MVTTDLHAWPDASRRLVSGCGSRPRKIECQFLSRGLAGKSIEVRGFDQATALLLEGFDSEVNMVAFLLGFVLFIGVCGFFDSRLSWPPRPTRRRK